MKSFLLLLALPLALFAGDFSLVFTGSLNGALNGCYCPGEPESGLVALAAFVNAFRAEHPNALFLDSGDILSKYIPRNVSRSNQTGENAVTRYCFEGFRYLRYDALVMGGQDVSKGAAYFLREAKTLPYVNANVTVNGERFGTPYTLKTVNGVTLAVIGVTGATVVFGEEGSDLERDRYLRAALTIENERRAIEAAVVSAKRNGANVVVLLSHAGNAQDRLFAETITGIDIIISGHDATLPLVVDEVSKTYADPPKLIESQCVVNGAYIFQTGKAGVYAGHADFSYEHATLKLTSARYHKINYGYRIFAKDKRFYEGYDVVKREGEFLYLRDAPFDPVVVEWIKKSGGVVYE